MDWLERLNTVAGPLPFGSGSLEIFGWAHTTHLMDNRPHSHTFFEACLVGSHGSGQFIVHNVPHRIGPGDLFIARPRVDHQIVNTAPKLMELFWVCFQWNPDSSDSSDSLSTILSECAQSNRLVAADSNSAVLSIWTALRAILDGPTPSLAHESQITGLTTALVTAIAQRLSDQAKTPYYFRVDDYVDATTRLAIRFIQDNFNRPLTVADIAAETCLSPRHLTRLFTTATGHPPARYITKVRLERAQTLLKTSLLPIKVVAESVGYPDVHHFTRAYSGRFNHTPGEERRNVKRKTS